MFACVRSQCVSVCQTRVSALRLLLFRRVWRSVSCRLPELQVRHFKERRELFRLRVKQGGISSSTPISPADGTAQLVIPAIFHSTEPKKPRGISGPRGYLTACKTCQSAILMKRDKTISREYDN